MAFPVGWPPRPASGRRNIRFFVQGTTTVNFSDNAYLFSQATGANTFVPTPNVPPGAINTTVHYGDYTAGGSPMGGGQMPDELKLNNISNMIWGIGLRVANTGANDLQFSFDGANVQGYVAAGKEAIYTWRHEAGIALSVASIASGSQASISFAGGVNTVTGMAGITVGMVGDQIIISGSSTPANNGTFTIASRLSATSVTIANASGATDASGAISWFVNSGSSGATTFLVESW